MLSGVDVDSGIGCVSLYHSKVVGLSFLLLVLEGRGCGGFQADLGNPYLCVKGLSSVCCLCAATSSDFCEMD